MFYSCPGTRGTLSVGTEEQASPQAGCWMKPGSPNPGWHQIDPCHSQKVIFPSKKVTLNADALSPSSSLQVSVPWTRAPEQTLPLQPPAGSPSQCLGLNSNTPPQRRVPDHPAESTAYPSAIHPIPQVSSLQKMTPVSAYLIGSLTYSPSPALFLAVPRVQKAICRHFPVLEI